METHRLLGVLVHDALGQLAVVRALRRALTPSRQLHGWHPSAPPAPRTGRGSVVGTLARQFEEVFLDTSPVSRVQRRGMIEVRLHGERIGEIVDVELDELLGVSPEEMALQSVLLDELMPEPGQDLEGDGDGDLVFLAGYLAIAGNHARFVADLMIRGGLSTRDLARIWRLRFELVAPESWPA